MTSGRERVWCKQNHSLTSAEKVTVSVLYWYEKLKFPSFLGELGQPLRAARVPI